MPCGGGPGVLTGASLIQIGVSASLLVDRIIYCVAAQYRGPASAGALMQRRIDPSPGSFILLNF